MREARIRGETRHERSNRKAEVLLLKYEKREAFLAQIVQVCLKSMRDWPPAEPHFSFGGCHYSWGG